MCVTSLELAKHVAKEVGDSMQYANDCNQGILVGGMTSSQVNLTRQEIQLLQGVCSSISVDIAEVCDSFRSLFKPLHGSSGMLYRAGEHVILDDCSPPQCVAELDRFLCVRIDGKYQRFVQARIYPMILDDDGRQMRDPYSGYNLLTKSTATLKISKVTAISRKVMLYPFDMASEPEAAIVIDFGRESLPDEVWDIIVPFYPKLNDMVLVEGEDPQPWLAKIVGIQERAKTIRVLYYEEDLSRPGQDLFVPMTSRLAYDYVPWDSVKGLPLGDWHGNAYEWSP